MFQAAPDRPISRESLREVRRPIGEARGLPNAAYTSADHFRRERDAVLGRTWVGLAFSDTVPSRPFAQPVEFMGLPLLITRDRHGALRVFHNVCSHRGMKLVAEPTEVPALITCRYHCWSYTPGGELKSTPHIGGVNQHTCPGFSPADHGLKEVRSAEFLGVLFINLSGDAVDFAQHIEPLRRRATAFVGEGGWPQLVSGSSDAGLSLEVRCNWKLAVENYCESYHLPWVHPSLNSYSKVRGSLLLPRRSGLFGPRVARISVWRSGGHAAAASFDVARRARARRRVPGPIPQRVARLSCRSCLRRPLESPERGAHSRGAAHLLCFAGRSVRYLCRVPRIDLERVAQRVRRGCIRRRGHAAGTRLAGLSRRCVLAGHGRADASFPLLGRAKARRGWLAAIGGGRIVRGYFAPAMSRLSGTFSISMIAPPGTAPHAKILRNRAGNDARLLAS